MISWKDCKFENIHEGEFTHCFEEQSVAAIRAALGARRPLLVRGEPGVGKSQLAKAAARALQRPLVSHVVTGRTEARDLHYRFDAVARLAQAQVLALAAKHAADGLDLLDEQKYVQPGPLWWVFNWDSADAQNGATRVHGVRPEDPDPAWKWKKETGSVVLLLDEIDKADPDVPNDLLVPLGDNTFRVEETGVDVYRTRELFVVITTNDERELPPAFLRRCVVAVLDRPRGDRLVAIARAHHPEVSDAMVRTVEEAADRFAEESEKVPGARKPGTAEILDALRACDAYGITTHDHPLWSQVTRLALWKYDQGRGVPG